MYRVYDNEFQALVCLKLMLIEGANRNLKSNNDKQAIDMIRGSRKHDVQVVNPFKLKRLLGP